MIGIIKRNFIHVDSNTVCLLYKALVRPILGYAHSVWCPHKKGDISEIEKVQKRATKLIISFKKFPYKERLCRLNLPTLKYRRVRGDMIDRGFKIINNVYSDGRFKNFKTRSISIRFFCKNLDFDFRSKFFTLPLTTP